MKMAIIVLVLVGSVAMETAVTHAQALPAGYEQEPVLNAKVYEAATAPGQSGGERAEEASKRMGNVRKLHHRGGAMRKVS